MFTYYWDSTNSHSIATYHFNSSLLSELVSPNLKPMLSCPYAQSREKGVSEEWFIWPTLEVYSTSRGLRSEPMVTGSDVPASAAGVRI